MQKNKNKILAEEWFKKSRDDYKSAKVVLDRDSLLMQENHSDLELENTPLPHLLRRYMKSSLLKRWCPDTQTVKLRFLYILHLPG